MNSVQKRSVSIYAGLIKITGITLSIWCPFSWSLYSLNMYISLQQIIGMDDWQRDKTITEAMRHRLVTKVGHDVTFHVGEAQEEVTAHRFILESRSHVMHVLLNGPMANKDALQPIVISDHYIDAVIFNLFLQ